MKDLQTIARPYAKAVFELAVMHQSLETWALVLHLLSQAVNDKQMFKLLDHPDLSQEMLVDILMEVVQVKVKDELSLIQHTLMVMAENRRLPLLPEISAQYDALCAEYAKSCAGVVYTSLRLTEQQMKTLQAGLEKRLKKTVNLTQVEDKALIGGAKIQIGDMVIDGSLKARVQRLYQALSA